MKNIREARNHSAGKILKYHEGDVWNMGEVEILQKLENDISEIKEMLKRLEIMLIGEEEIGEDEKKELEKRLKEAEKGETIELNEFLRKANV